MIAQKKKNKIIELYMLEINELESFTLLKVSLEELLRLKSCSKHWETKGNKLISTYETGDELDKTFKEIAVEHQKLNAEFKDVSKTWVSDVSGTSMLIRDPATKIIRIAFRKADQKCSINKIYIDNYRRELFFNDSKRSTYFRKTHKYAITHEDNELYKYWSNFMNNQYFLETSNKKGE